MGSHRIEKFTITILLGWVHLSPNNNNTSSFTHWLTDSINSYNNNDLPPLHKKNSICFPTVSLPHIPLSSLLSCILSCPIPFLASPVQVPQFPNTPFTWVMCLSIEFSQSNLFCQNYHPRKTIHCTVPYHCNSNLSINSPLQWNKTQNLHWPPMEEPFCYGAKLTGESSGPTDWLGSSANTTLSEGRIIISSVHAQIEGRKFILAPYHQWNPAHTKGRPEELYAKGVGNL